MAQLCRLLLRSDVLNLVTKHFTRVQPLDAMRSYFVFPDLVLLTAKKLNQTRI